MLLFEVGFVEIQGMATVILFALCFYLLTELREIRRDLKLRQPASDKNNILSIQAYERLTLLTDRIALKNLVSRTFMDSLTAAEMQAGLVETIRKEYEYNFTQQNYVNPDVWKAITKMKDQNIFIINQLAGALPQDAHAIDLSNLLLEYSGKTNAELSPVVLDAIQYEVKKLM